jgi:hypothetical protein
MAAIAPQTADAQRLAKPSSGQRLQETTANDVPRCARKLGTLSIADGDDPYGWTRFSLAPPSKLLKVLVARSGCLTWSIAAAASTRRRRSATSAVILAKALSPCARRRRPAAPSSAPPPGSIVYPTGPQSGLWWEAADENDNVGWVLKTRLAPSQ